MAKVFSVASRMRRSAPLILMLAKRTMRIRTTSSQIGPIVRVSQCSKAQPSAVQNCGHLNASTIAFKAKAGFYALQLLVKLCLCIALHKSARCVKRSIPWHIRVGTKCHGFKASASRFSEGRIDELAADALLTALGNDRQLLKMGEPLELEDVNETTGIIIFRIRSDQDKTGR